MATLQDIKDQITQMQQTATDCLTGVGELKATIDTLKQQASQGTAVSAQDLDDLSKQVQGVEDTLTQVHDAESAAKG